MPHSSTLDVIIRGCYQGICGSGDVYFVHPRGTRYLKIGYSTDLTRRVSKLQACWSEPLVLLALLQGDTLVEKSLHGEFAADLADLTGAVWDNLRCAGGASEWFVLSPALIDFMHQLPDTCLRDEAFRNEKVVDKPPRAARPGPPVAPPDIGTARCGRPRGFPRLAVPSAEEMRAVLEDGSIRAMTRDGRALLQTWKDARG